VVQATGARDERLLAREPGLRLDALDEHLRRLDLRLGHVGRPHRQLLVAQLTLVGAAKVVLEVAAELNARPRKTLGGITPAQAMQRLLFDPQAPIVATTA